MGVKITRLLTLLFCLVYVGILLVEYVFQHPWYREAISFFQYVDFLLYLLVGIGGAAFFWHRKQPKPAHIRGVNGLSIFAASWLLVLVASILFFAKIDNASMSAAGAMNLTLFYWGVGLGVFVIMVICFVMGDFLLKLFPLTMRPLELAMIKMGVGIMSMIFLLFLLGSLHLLTPWFLFPFFLGICMLNIPGGRRFLSQILIKPIPLPTHLNALGIVTFGFLMVFVALNFVQTIRPIPLGYDAHNLYMRLPALIHDYQGLVDGFQPYNWSLFMSAGFVFWGRIEVTLALSYSGGVLSLFALYAIARRWLTVNHSMLVLVLFYVTPMVSYHSYQDMKVDLGLLFFSLCLAILLINWLTPYSPPTVDEPLPPKPPASSQRPQKKNTKRHRKGRKKPIASPAKHRRAIFDKDWPFVHKWRARIERATPAILKGQGLVVWLGLFTGFALGIKLTSLMLFFPILVVIWYQNNQYALMFGMLSLSLFGVLFLQLDSQAALRQWHLGANMIQWLLAAIGGILLGWQAFRHWQVVRQKLLLSVIYGSFFLLAFSPWIIKNVSETGKLDKNSIIYGKNTGPVVTFESLGKNWENQKKKLN